MNRRVFLWLLLVFVPLFGLPAPVQAACDGSDMTGGSHCLYYGGFSVVGGALDGTIYDLAAGDMYPYQERDTSADLAYWYQQALSAYNDGYGYRQSLLLIDGVPGEGTPQGRMLLNPRLNYESAGLLSNLSATEAKLIQARDTFAYDLYMKYPDEATARAKLQNTIKALASIYLMIGDEFLIDALEFRFSADTLGMEQKLDEQICLLGQGEAAAQECIAAGTTQYPMPQHGAQYYYEKAVDTFLYGFSTAVGTNIFAVDHYDDSLFSLFSLAVERLSMALREKSSKQLARLMSPDSAQQEAARQQSLVSLRTSYGTTYLATAAIAQKQGSGFLSKGGDRLVNALTSLQRVGNIYANDLNPLGYDDRYIPMREFTEIYDDAKNYYQSALSSRDAFNIAQRDFDADVDKLRTAIQGIATNTYRQQLASLTGLSVSDPTFMTKAATAGDDLLDCPIDSADFATCVATKTQGVLGSKYRQMRDAQLRVDAALLKKENLLERVTMENEKHQKMLEIENRYFTTYRDTLQNYLKNMKDARQITKTKTKTKGKPSETSTVTSYYLKNDNLRLEVGKEIDLQKALMDYRIAQMNVTDELVIKDLLNNIAETEIEIGLAIQQKNSAVADFDNGIIERDNLVFLARQSDAHLLLTADEMKEKIPEVRILQSQAALNLSRDINSAVHYTYLAAKALEYKYLKKLVNIPMAGNQYLNITDLFKVQTTEDLNNFLNMLKASDTCSWGSKQNTPIRISLAKEILGLTDKYLNPTGSLSAQEVIALRRQQVQAFLSGKVDKGTNALKYGFSTSLNDSYVSKYRMYGLKIWWGTYSPPCDPVAAKGIAVQFQTTQQASILPWVQLSQKGHSTFLNSSGSVVEYTPVSQYLNLQSGASDESVVTRGNFSAYVNTDPAIYATWSNSFKGRSVAASDWEMVISDIGDYPIDWGKVTDIVLYIEAMGTPLP